MPPRAKEIAFAAQPHVLEGGRVISAPFQYLVEGDHHLKIEGWNTAAGARLQVSYRFAGLDGKSRDERHELALTDDRVVAEAHVGLQPGYLLNMCVFATGASPLIGQTFVCIKLIRGLGEAAITIGLLLQGHVTHEQGLGWPGSPIEDSLAGAGVARSIIGTDPAAGVVINEVVPTGARWELITARAILNTDATIVNRRPFITADDGVSVFWKSHHPLTLAASQTRVMYWAQGMPLVTALHTDETLAGMPAPALLFSGWRLRMNAESLQAGDNFDAPVIQVREWLEAS